MKKALWLAVALLVAAALSGEAFAQMGWRMGGWGRGGPYQRMYDPETVETISGEVVGVDYVEPLKGMGQGVHLKVKSEDETIPVHLGPRWFIENQESQVEEGDQVTVKGSRVSFDDEPALIAAEVEKGEEVLTLRDEQGFPVWAGWRRKAR